MTFLYVDLLLLEAHSCLSAVRRCAPMTFFHVFIGVRIPTQVRLLAQTGNSGNKSPQFQDETMLSLPRLSMTDL